MLIHCVTKKINPADLLLETGFYVYSCFNTFTFGVLLLLGL